MIKRGKAPAGIALTFSCCVLCLSTFATVDTQYLFTRHGQARAFEHCLCDSVRVRRAFELYTFKPRLACLPACPVGAFHADDDVADVLQCITRIESEPVEVLCGLHPQAQTGTQPDAIGIQIRGCLAGLGTGAYLTFSALGVKRILVRTDACRTCKWQALASEIHRQAERADHFLTAWEKGNTILCVQQVEAPVERSLWNAKNPPLSRRDLFRLMARQGQVAMALECQVHP